MDQRRAPEYTLEISADRSNVKDVVKGILDTIFFHRFFTTISPAIHDVLDITLPYVPNDAISTLVDARAASLVRQLESAAAIAGPGSSPPGSGPRGRIVVQFNEKKRRKGWFVAKADEETTWECWVVEVTMLVSSPQSIGSSDSPGNNGGGRRRGADVEDARLRRATETSLRRAVMRIVETVNLERAHIPPITTTESNPFPYQILVNPRADTWGQKMGIF